MKRDINFACRFLPLLALASLMLASTSRAQFSWDPQFSAISGLSTHPTLAWHPNPGAVRYEIQVSHDANFSSLLLDDTSIVDTQRTLGPLAPDTGYYARVNALTADGVTLSSDVVKFYAESGIDVYTLALPPGWALISFPLNVSDATRNFLFPSPCSPTTVPGPAFCYDGGYVCCSGYFLLHSYGFWIKIPYGQMLGVTGVPLFADTESIRAGWNLIGSIFTPISVPSIQKIPPTMVTGNLYAYGVSGYLIASQIEPYGGYWMKADVDGRLILQSTTQPPGRIRAYVHWQDEGLPNMKIVLVETNDTLYTDRDGMVEFTVPAGKYVVRAFNINRGGPSLLSIDFDVVAYPGRTTEVDIVDCLPCF